MPIHVVVAFIDLVLALAAAATAIVYAWAAGARRPLRYPLLAASVLATIASFVSYAWGSVLLSAVKNVGSTEEIAAARSHGHNSDILIISLVSLTLAVVVCVFWLLRPSRRGWSPLRVLAGAVLTAASIAVIVAVVVVAAQAIAAVSTAIPSWTA